MFQIYPPIIGEGIINKPTSVSEIPEIVATYSLGTEDDNNSLLAGRSRVIAVSYTHLTLPTKA